MNEWVQVPAGIHLLTAALLSVWSATVWLRADAVMSLESSRLFNLIMMLLKLFCQVVPEDSCSSLPALGFTENWRVDEQRTQAHLASSRRYFSLMLSKNDIHTAVFQFNYVKSETKQERNTSHLSSTFWVKCIWGSFALFFWSGFSDIHVLTGYEWLICCKLTIISCTALPANG